MEEAERLCDRIAVFDSGRIVALDTPAALAAGADADADAGRSGSGRTGRLTRPTCSRCPRSAACNGAATR
jgi:ABC-type multidrug transport system ATPase subunit